MLPASGYDADVAVIGYGPSGVVAANTLGLRGVSVLAFERDKDIHPRARAVTVNDWTMRILQDLGLDEEVRKVVNPQRALRWVQYDGTELMRIQFPPSLMDPRSGARGFDLYQPAFEAVLRAGAERFGDRVEVGYGWEVTDLVPDDDGVTLTARDVSTGEERSVRTRYAIAADGGSSPTRKALGIPLAGDTLPVTWIVIDCDVKQWWPNRDYLTFWSDKQRPVVDIPLPLGHHRWELPLREDESPQKFATAEDVWPLLDDMGVTRDAVDIRQYAFYQHHVRMAETWRAGRVFLVGDAAHLMPPWAGSGMQSGIRDAYDVSWKLARVLDGEVDERFLDTYEAERRPNVDHYTQLAVELGSIIKQELPEEVLKEITAPPPPGEEVPEHPLFAAPTLVAGWFRGPVGKEEQIIGTIAPQSRVATRNGEYHRLDDHLGPSFALLGDGVRPEEVLTAEEKAGWDALGARYLTVRQVDQRTVGDDEIVDMSGWVLDWMRAHGVQVVALRPDRFAAACDATGLAVPDWPPVGR